MRPNVILLVALLVVSAGVLAAGCTMPGGNVTPPTAPPTGTETPSVTETTAAGTETPAATATTVATVTTAATTAAAGGKTATVDLTAENIKFDKSTITVPAGAAVTVNFNNKDSGVPHNFAVYTDSSASQNIFKGDTVTGPATTTYTFTAPATPGTYFFRCDVHPQQMTGDFIVQ
ncbi:MAG: cupredoxin domain-containing protein [Methanomicrobiaceae archaeon]|uniref:cupredoxin domain-containing protein n=1 Tax=Methanoculleus sp. TaxID=90427 RepID=UPI00320DB4E5|nr:cupredoxin domain-containing protein [Methanomicrobiaceae archaeon]